MTYVTRLALEGEVGLWHDPVIHRSGGCADQTLNQWKFSADRCIRDHECVGADIFLADIHWQKEANMKTMWDPQRMTDALSDATCKRASFDAFNLP